MTRALILMVVLSTVGLAAATPKQDPLDQRVIAIAKAVHLTAGQTTALRRYTTEFQSELSGLLRRFPEPQARAPFSQALISRFRNRVRELMTPQQFARFESLERNP